MSSRAETLNLIDRTLAELSLIEASLTAARRGQAVHQ